MMANSNGLGMPGKWRKTSTVEESAAESKTTKEEMTSQVRNTMEEMKSIPVTDLTEPTTNDQSPSASEVKIVRKSSSDRSEDDQSPSASEVKIVRKSSSDRSVIVPKPLPHKAASTTQTFGLSDAPKKRINSPWFKESVNIVAGHLQRHCYVGNEFSTTLAADKFYRGTASMRRMLLAIADLGNVEKIGPGKWRYLG